MKEILKYKLQKFVSDSDGNWGRAKSPSKGIYVIRNEAVDAPFPVQSVLYESGGGQVEFAYVFEKEVDPMDEVILGIFEAKVYYVIDEVVEAATPMRFIIERQEVPGPPVAKPDVGVEPPRPRPISATDAYPKVQRRWALYAASTTMPPPEPGC